MRNERDSGQARETSKETGAERRLTPLKAIRAKCLDCAGGSCKEVRLCPNADCPLHFFRAGKNPNRAGIGNPKPLPGAGEQRITP